MSAFSGTKPAMGFATLLVGQLTGMDEPARPLRASVRVRAGLGVSRRPITVIHVSGDHDYRSRAVLLETLAPLEGHTVIDLTDCTLIDPSVIAGIIGKALALGKDGYRLELVVPTYGSLSRVVERLGIHSLIPVVDKPPAIRPLMP